MPGRHGLLEGLFQRRAYLAGAVAGRAGDVELRGVVFVEAEDEFGAGDLLDLHQRSRAAPGCRWRCAHRTGSMFSMFGARSAFRLDIGLPLAAEAVEVVDQVSAHEGLHGGVDVGELHLLLRGLFLVDIGIELGHGRLDTTGWRRRSPAACLSAPRKAKTFLVRRRDRRSRSGLRGSW